jgi:hypothetical protein
MSLSLVTGAWTESDRLSSFFGVTFSAQPRPVLGGEVYVKDEPGESIMQATTGTLDMPMRYRISSQGVQNVFTGTGLEPQTAQRRDGVSFLCQLTEAWKVYDTGDAGVVPYYLPVSAHLVTKVPIDALVTPAEVAGLWFRLMLGLSRAYDDTVETPLAALLAGATRLGEPASHYTGL